MRKFALLASLLAACSACGEEGDLPAQVEIVNQSTYTLYILHAWPCEDSDKGPNLLLGRPVNPGGILVVPLAAGCWNLAIDGGDRGKDTAWTFDRVQVREPITIVLEDPL